jgi:serine/threonine-protein kinase
VDPERWKRLSPLLDAMLELDAATRARSLALLREEDPVTGAELCELLALEDEREDFLAEPLVAPLPGARAGTLAGPYRLERLLGEGGMGQVWLAGRADGLYQRRVALKLLRPGLADPNLRLRFTRERQILARLAHPHIARLLDAGISSDGQPYLALEYVEGEAINDWCRRRNLSLDARLRLFLQTCDAVSHAHANLIVHRDLKPSNILVTAHEEVRLLDFGIAKLLDTADLAPEQTGTGLRAFTLHYAAPEQVRGEPVTTMTDVYALGVVLHELLTGTRPYVLKRRTDAEWEEAIIGAEPLRPSLAVLHGDGEGEVDEEQRPAGSLRRLSRALAGDLDNIVLKALAKRPEQRYPSVEALALDIARYRNGRPVLARPQQLGYRLRKYGYRHRWVLATALLVTLVLGSAFGIVAWQARQAVQEATRAQALQDFVIGLFERAGDGDAPLDVRALLDAGLRRGNRELAQQPAARAELMGVIARLRLGMGDYLPARALLREQAGLLHGLGTAAPASLRLESATDRGRAAWLLGDGDDCRTMMLPLLAVAQREQKQLPVQAADFWSQLGRCERAIGSPEAARPLFQRALAVRRDLLHDEVGAARNLGDLADLQADAGQSQLALQGYGTALRRLRAGAGARQPLGAELMRKLCVLRRDSGDTIGAERDCSHALSLARELHGEGHPATIAALRAMAVMQVEIGRYAEAAQSFAQTRAWTIAHAGGGHADVADDDDGIARIAWERGDFAASLAALDQALAVLSRRHDPAQLSAVLAHKAQVLHDAGRNADALVLLQRARKLRVTQFGPAHPSVADTDRQLGEVEAALGDDARALAALSAAAHDSVASLGAAHPQSRRAQLALARFQARRGDAAALGRLDQLARQHGPREIDMLKVAGMAGASAAAQRCHGPLRERAQAQLRALAAEVRNALPEGGSTAREVAALQATCALQ